jgi:hypothetical protein
VHDQSPAVFRGRREPQKAAENSKRQPQMNANDADGVGARSEVRGAVNRKL